VWKSKRLLLLLLLPQPPPLRLKFLRTKHSA
jgi:hypothetical protein